MLNMLLKIALERYTDDKAFEELAYDVIMESYPNAERSGGTHDKGIDAEETLHFEDKDIKRKFQFSIEKDVQAKIKKTVKRFNDEQVDWDELVYVSNREINVGNTKTWFVGEYNKKIAIYDQQAIDNILTNNSALWRKHFPSIPMPEDIYENPLENRQLHENMLKSSLLYASDAHEDVKTKRTDLFEQFVLSIALTDKIVSYASVSKTFDSMFHKPLRMELFEEAVGGLVKSGMLQPINGEIQSWKISQHATDTIKTNEESVSDERSELIDDIIVEVKAQLGEKASLTKEDETRVKSNIKNVLNKFFQLYGTDFAIDKGQIIFTEFRKQEILKEKAGYKLDTYIADTILYSIGKIIEAPSEKQLHTLSLLSNSFICAQIMQVDPLLTDCQTEVLKEKLFILDTDIVLHSIVPESKNCASYQKMINALVKRGCLVCVPESVIEEVVIHAESALGNYKRFKASYSTKDKSTLSEDYRNVFVDGFFTKNAQDPLVSFENYISNYYDKSEPRALILSVFEDMLPKGVIIGQNELWKGDVNIPEEEIESLSKKLYVKTLDTAKAEYRTEAGNELIARNDALIYLTAYHLSNQEQRGMLSQQCYVITTSTRTIKCAKDINLFKSVVTKPLLIISILSKLGLFDAGYDVVDLLGNPFLSKIASENWEELERLARLGVDLRGKKIPRLLLDLKAMIHKDITSEVDAEIEAMDTRVDLLPPRDAMQQYVDLAQSVESAGYHMMPLPQQIIKTYRAEIEKNKQKDEEIAKLKLKKKKKDKSRERYEKKYSENKK